MKYKIHHCSYPYLDFRRDCRDFVFEDMVEDVYAQISKDIKKQILIVFNKQFSDQWGEFV